MTKTIGIGVLAGLVSALLFGVLIKATALALFLYLFAPLPILIVGLGWSHKAALAAVASGSLALAAMLAPAAGLKFAVYIALPAWWLAYLALLGRPRSDGSLEWYPLGRLLAWVAGTAALAFVAIAVVATPDYQTYRARLDELARQLVQVQMTGKPPTPAPAPNAETGETPPPAQEPPPVPQTPDDLQGEVARTLASLAPGIVGQGLTVLMTFYLWLAARIVQISGRLMRPWPDIPATTMPRGVLAVFAAAIGLALVGGYPGVLGTALAGALAAAFALQGLAAFHDRSRGRPARGALLFGLYIVLFFTQGLALVALTLFGIADTAMARRAGRPSDPTLSR